MQLIAQVGDDQQQIASINHALAGLDALAVEKTVDRDGSGHSARIAFGLKCYRGAAILRLRQLARGICREYNTGDVVCALILARQLVESAAHFIDSTVEVKKLLAKKPPDLEQLVETVKRRVFGTKLEGLDDVKPEQILNCIDGADRLVGEMFPDVAKRERKPIRKNYDFLSELVHPNCFALLFHIEWGQDSALPDAILYPEGWQGKRLSIAGFIRRALIILDVFLLGERSLASSLETLVSLRDA